MRLLIARGRGSGRASIRVRSYLQFSFVNNKPWPRRGSDFNEGINNPGCARGGREGGVAEGREYTAGMSEIRADVTRGEKSSRSFGRDFTTRFKKALAYVFRITGRSREFNPAADALKFSFVFYVVI